MKTFKIAIVTLAVIIISSGFIAFQGKKPWTVPDKYKKMANPVKADKSALSNGKSLWVKHCQSCHGKHGQGDGPKAAQLKTEPGDFSTAAAQAESDGSLFYKTTEGRDDMPSFKKKIPDDEDRWSLVLYLRTFKK